MELFETQRVKAAHILGAATLSALSNNSIVIANWQALQATSLQEKGIQHTLDTQDDGIARCDGAG